MSAAGRRDTLIVFQRDTGTTKDAHGGKIENWQTYASEWAAVQFGSAQERRQAAQELASQTATFRVPSNSKMLALNPKDRIAGYLGSDWDITSVAQFDRSDTVVTAIRLADR